MKYTILFAVLMLVGCDQWVPKTIIDEAIIICSDHGGMTWTGTNLGDTRAVCKDGSEWTVSHRRAQ